MQQAIENHGETPPVVHTVFRVFLWIAWAAMLFGPVSMAGCIALIFSTSTPPVPGDPHGVVILDVVGAVLPVFSVGVTQGVRYWLFGFWLRRRNGKGLVIGYPVAKIICWAACEGAVFFNLVICLIAGTFWPSAVTALVVWMVMAADMPLMGPFKRWNAGAEPAGEIR